MTLPPELTKPKNDRRGSKVGDLVRRLGSDNDYDLINSVRAIGQVLKRAGYDFHELAAHIENQNGQSVSEADLQKVFDHGFMMGVQHAESQRHGATEFVNTNGSATPDWRDIAHFLQRNKARLQTKHHQFVDDMVARAASKYFKPTPKQDEYLEGLFLRLGGKIT